MKTANILTLLVILVAGTFVYPGCGNYTMKNQYRTGIDTVYVPMWTRGRDVYRRGIEMRLTKAIVQRIEMDTPYKVTAKERADTELTGQIKRITQRVLSRNPETGLPRELEATFTLSYTWKDLRTGQVIAEHTNFRVSDTYIPHEPVNEDFYQGSEAAINRIARRIVEQMEAPW